MKKKVTLVLAALLSVGMILSLTAGGGGSDKETVSYKVGTEPTFPPFVPPMKIRTSWDWIWT